MAKYSIAAVIGCVYVALSVWMVHREGEAYRAGLQQKRLALRERNPGPAQLATNPPDGRPTAKPPAADAAPVATTPSPRVVPSSPAPPTVAAIPSTPEHAVASAAAPAPHAPKFDHVPPAPKAPANGQPEPLDPGFVWADTLNIGQLNADEERRLGRELHKLIMKYNRPLESGAYDQRIEEAARPFLKKCTRKEVDYTFTVLDSAAVNAFSHPGGYIYISEGLFSLIGEDEEYALEFVVGHEVAHVDMKHALQCIAGGNAEEKKRGLSTLPQFYLLIAFGYPDKMEAEADAWACRRMMLDLDRSRHDALAFLRKLEGYAQRHGFAQGRKLPPEKPETPGETPPSMADNHFRALTAARRRLGNLKSLSETIKTPQK